MFTIGIVGYGFVGKATSILECEKIKLKIFDIDSKLCFPIGTKLIDLINLDAVFICVPTPMDNDGKCNLNIVNSVVEQLKQLKCKNIVIRSTIPIGTSKKLNCDFMPEFLTEKNFVNDFINCQQWIIGSQRKEFFQQLFTTAKECGSIKYDNCLFMGTNEAELVKYSRNCFLSVKVSFFNEIEEFCRKKGLNYEEVRKGTGGDPRIGISHTNVPGHDGHRGFGGICFPKDMSSMISQMESINMKSYVLESAYQRNINVDRPEKDWEKFEGRAVSKKITKPENLTFIK